MLIKHPDATAQLSDIPTTAGDQAALTTIPAQCAVSHPECSQTGESLQACPAVGLTSLAAGLRLPQTPPETNKHAGSACTAHAGHLLSNSVHFTARCESSTYEGDALQCMSHEEQFKQKQEPTKKSAPEAKPTEVAIYAETRTLSEGHGGLQQGCSFV